MGFIPNEYEHEDLDPKRYWHNRWVRALKNMPAGRRGGGQSAALCILLGWPTHRVDGGGQYSCHNRIFTNLCRGSKPRDPERVKKLERLAGHDGKLVAWLTLAKMGYGKRFKI